MWVSKRPRSATILGRYSNYAKFRRGETLRVACFATRQDGYLYGGANVSYSNALIASRVYNVVVKRKP